MSRIIAIDGPASVGKSSLAKIIAERFNYSVLHSGVLYRLAAYYILEKNIDINNLKGISHCVKAIDYRKIGKKNLYITEIDRLSSEISSRQYVRDELKKYQRNYVKTYGDNKKFMIVEGRDIGTVVFPDARHKIFMWANSKIRAARRHDQLQKKVSNLTIIRFIKRLMKITEIWTEK